MGKVVVTGGLGFVGANYAAHCLRRGDRVVVVDDCSRGTSSGWNEGWLRDQQRWLGQLSVSRESVASKVAMRSAVEGADRVVHAAAQSSVDVSMRDPERDFVANVEGTFRVLEAVRHFAPEARVVFLASNKIYETSEWSVGLAGTRYRWVGRSAGPNERFPFYMDAKEPYGASKIAGVYYCRTYAALYCIPVVVAVPSGMYGPRQFGKAEQGWLGWFAIAIALGLPLTIHGDGYQVRDMCEVSDVCSALDVLLEIAPRYRGELFNLGGGPSRAVSLVEAIELLEQRLRRRAVVQYDNWRPMDNKVYVSNIEKLVSVGWTPYVGLVEGVDRLCAWVESMSGDLRGLYACA